MEVIEKDLSVLKPYEKNPRKNDEAVGYVAESISEYGFKVPLVISPDNEIICGHTRYKAAQSLGLKTVPCIIADDLTTDQIRAFRLADNKTSDMSIWDNKLLLEELDALPDDLFTGFELGDIFSELNRNDLDAIEDNEYGVVYEIKFRSEDKEIIDMVKAYWEELISEEGCSGSGNFGEETGRGESEAH